MKVGKPLMVMKNKEMDKIISDGTILPPEETLEILHRIKKQEKKRMPRSRERGPGKANTHRVSFSVSCQPEEREAIKKLAEKKGITISELVLSLIQ